MGSDRAKAGDILRAARKAKKLSMLPLANHLGISVTRVSDIERGYNWPCEMPEELKERWCKAIGLDSWPLDAKDVEPVPRTIGQIVQELNKQVLEFREEASNYRKLAEDKIKELRRELSSAAYIIAHASIEVALAGHLMSTGLAKLKAAGHSGPAVEDLSNANQRINSLAGLLLAAHETDEEKKFKEYAELGRAVQEVLTAYENPTKSKEIG